MWLSVASGLSRDFTRKRWGRVVFRSCCPLFSAPLFGAQDPKGGGRWVRWFEGVARLDITSRAHASERIGQTLFPEELEETLDVDVAALPQKAKASWTRCANEASRISSKEHVWCNAGVARSIA